MGYWHTSNTDTNFPQPNLALRTSDQAACGVTVKPSSDISSRKPLVDFAGSDSIFLDADYKNFPDLLLLPALAGAAVPVYNIPSLGGAGALVLNRSTITDIFLGTQYDAVVLFYLLVKPVSAYD